jgi:hypothetical protein
MLLGALSAATALLAACSDPPPPPLGNGGIPGTQCMSYARGRPVTTGIWDLTNSGSTNVTIKHLALPSAHGLKVNRWWLVPIFHDPKNGNFVDVGAGAPYPPTTAPEWPRREPATGAVIGPRQRFNLVFGLSRTSARAGRSAGPLITYSAGGYTYSVQELTTLIVAANCSVIR